MKKDKKHPACDNCFPYLCNSKNKVHSTITVEEKSSFFETLEINKIICGDCQSEYKHRTTSDQKVTLRKNKYNRGIS